MRIKVNVYLLTWIYFTSLLFLLAFGSVRIVLGVSLHKFCSLFYMNREKGICLHTTVHKCTNSICTQLHGQDTRQFPKILKTKIVGIKVINFAQLCLQMCYIQSWACTALSVTKLSLYALFCNALKLSLFIFEIVAFCDDLQCNGPSPFSFTSILTAKKPGTKSGSCCASVKNKIIWST
jgi:hypothetical protein